MKKFIIRDLINDIISLNKKVTTFDLIYIQGHNLKVGQLCSHYSMDGFTISQIIHLLTRQFIYTTNSIKLQEFLKGKDECVFKMDNWNVELFKSSQMSKEFEFIGFEFDEETKVVKYLFK